MYLRVCACVLLRRAQVCFVCFHQIAVFEDPPGHAYAFSESPDCELQDAPMISAIRARGKSICWTQSRVRAKSPCLRTPPGIPEFWREIGM